MARLGAGLLVLGGLVAVSLVAATPIAASRATTPAEALFVGPAVALATTSAGGCNAVWLSHDFSTWTELAPLGTLCSSYSWASAAFVSPQLGWLYGIDRALVRAVLLRTDDGGAHWTREPAGTLGGFKAEVSIGFSSAHLGWRQQFNVGANGGFGLELTLDGGKSWRRLPYPSGHGGCEWWPDSFATTRRGFAGPTLGPSANGLFPEDVSLSPFLLETTDQGAGWHRFGLPAPASLRLDHAYYQLPRFFANGLGVLAVFYAGSQHSNVAFYETSDAGSTWRLVDVADEGGDPSAAAVQPVSGRGDLSSCGPYLLSGAAVSVPEVSLASPTTWWIVAADARSVMMTSDAGRTWSVRRVGLPISADDYGASLMAADARDAVLNISPPMAEPRALLTSDGGASWARLSP